jgi:hypothetical protein
MIDTISLLIPKDHVVMLVATSKIGVPKWELYSKTDQYDKYVKNPTKKNIDSGLYYPRLTGYRRKGYGQKEAVRIEFSVPSTKSVKCLVDGTDSSQNKTLPTHNRLREK